MKSIEVYGFVGWVSSYILFISYMLWAFLPESFLQILGINYVPSKYWAMAVPSLIVMIILTGLFSYMALSMMIIIPPSSRKSLQDEHTRLINLKKTELHEGLPEVYDIPAPVFNNILYYQNNFLWYKQYQENMDN